jgi:hypothetical protein
MSQPPRGHASSGRLEPSGRTVPRPRTAADLELVVREFAGRVARLERELAELRAMVGQIAGEPQASIGVSAQIR